MHLPRLVIAGLAGGSGKTLVSLGLTRAYLRAGKKVKTFKKGPDYIDATFLAHAAMSKKGNLDNYFCDTQTIVQLFINGATNHDLSLIEGSRGLFDGLDVAGSTSTTELASQLQAPIILVINCQKITRTAAALVLGCTQLDPNVHIAGVILNNIGTKRQQEIITAAIEKYTTVPVLGVVPRQKNLFIQERQGFAEQLYARENLNLAQLPLPDAQLDAQLDALADVIKAHVNLDALFTIAEKAPGLSQPVASELELSKNNFQSIHAISLDTSLTTQPKNLTQPKHLTQTNHSSQTIIGYIQDAAFWCYYEENLDALEKSGATLIPLRLLDATPWPEIHGLYIGGGEPEQYIEQLAVNTTKLKLLHHLASQDLPLYAESAGLIPLSHTFCMNNQEYPMANIFAASFSFAKRPQGLGYIEGQTIKASAFFPSNLPLKGHEFHFYSHTPLQLEQNAYTVTLTKGKGLINSNDTSFDGFAHKNLFASLFHIYAPSLPHWAPTFTHLAQVWKNKRCFQ